MESGLQGAYTRQTRARKRHRVVTEERNRQAGPGAGNVRRKQDASQGDSTCFQIGMAGMISHRHTGCQEGSGSKDSQCKGPGVEMASSSSRNRKDHKVEVQQCDDPDWVGGRLQAEQARLNTIRWILSPAQQEAMGGKGLHRRWVQLEEGGYGCSQNGSYLRELLGA